MKSYEINGRTFEHRPLVPGQLQQLLQLLHRVPLPQNSDPLSVLMAVGGPVMPAVIAVLLTEAGQSPRDKDLPALEEEFRWHLPSATAVEVLADFFEVTPLASALERLATAVASLKKDPSAR